MKARTAHLGSFRWQDVPVLEYKPEPGSFRDVSRQVLFGADAGLPCELRYFEIAPGGHSTLERHEHAHAVVIQCGEGRALVGNEIVELRPLDLVWVPPRTWHQFRTRGAAPLGFLCLVARDRDRPVRPGDAELEELRRDPEVAAFLRG
jgi:mannose-6-phosphate isomerase-like protein (cupin superfamily)